MNRCIHIVIWLMVSGFASVSFAIEQKFSGLIDVRYSSTDSVDSYLNGGYGKFRFNDGNQLSLAQAAINYQLSWQDTWSIHLIANGYADNTNDGIGLSEYYVQYKSLPSSSGYRYKIRGGFIYPKISVTNVLTGWSSPYTLSYSTINSWLAEELRHKGVEFSLTRLGRIANSNYDFEVNVSAFQGNDPAGAVLAWYGWNNTSRQILHNETQPLPNAHIRFVPNSSDVFSELDHRTGFELNTKWTWHGKGKLVFGYYDNQADPKVVKNVQWAWRTKFFHLGVKWQLVPDLDMLAQYLVGDTLMQTPSGSADLVFNDYDSAYLMLSKKLSQHRFSGRIEKFSVTDKDQFSFDNNNESGTASTLSYSYRVTKHLFFHGEFNWIRSKRPSRTTHELAETIVERQFQLATRYYF